MSEWCSFSADVPPWVVSIFWNDLSHTRNAGSDENANDDGSIDEEPLVNDQRGFSRVVHDHQR
jgi:hypothetical protein